MASHRLIQWIGKTYGLDVSEAVYDALNTYHFVDGNALNDKPLLASTVAENLLLVLGEDKAPSKERLLEFLQGSDGRAEIEQALATLNEIGVHSIPKFIIGGSYVVDGAAESEVLVQSFRAIEKRGRIDREPIFAEILGVKPEIVQRGSHHREHESA